MPGDDVYSGNDQYFEGTLQVRNPTQEVLDFIDSEIDRTPGVHIARVIQVTNGYDFLISSQRFIRAIGKRLQERFPGELKYSRKIFTRDRQSSKEVYRVTAMFRPSGFQKGDTVQYRGEECEVIGFGPKLLLKNKKTGKKIECHFGDGYLRP